MKHLCLTLFTLLLSIASFAVIGPITGTTTLCAGSTSPLADTSSGGTWGSSDVAIASIGLASGVVTGVAAGMATITYTTGSGYVTAIVTVHAMPNLYTVTGGGTYCTGGTGLAVGLSGSDGGTDYFLHIGSSTEGPYSGTGGALPFGLQSAAGVYTVNAVNTTTSCGAVMMGSVTITIAPVVSPSVTISASPGDTVCLGTSTVFTATPVYGGVSPSYEWKVNGTIVATGATYTYVPANGDQVTIKLTSDAPCVVVDTAVDTLVMSVNLRMAPAVILAELPGDTVCTGYFATFTATPVYGGASPVYIWMVNGAVVGSGPAYTYVPANMDLVKCELVSDYRCLSFDTTADSVRMAVITPVIPSFSINAVPGYELELGTNDTLVAVASGGAPHLAYQWAINDSLITGATSDTFIYNNVDVSHRTDSVSCIISSDGFCTVSTTNWSFITGIDEGVKTVGNESIFALFPNPNNGVFTITGSLGSATPEEVTAEVMDMPGHTVYKEKTMAVNGKLNKQISLPITIPDGMYMLKIYSGKGSKVFAFVVAR